MGIRETLLDCKISTNASLHFKDIMQTLRTTQANYFTKKELAKSSQEELKSLQEQYAIALSLEPSVEEIANQASTEGNCTELRTALKQVKITQAKYLTSLNNAYSTEEKLEEAKDQYAIALSFEPTQRKLTLYPQR